MSAIAVGEHSALVLIDLHKGIRAVPASSIRQVLDECGSRRAFCCLS